MHQIKLKEVPAFLLLILISAGITAGSFIYWDWFLVSITCLLAILFSLVSFRFKKFLTMFCLIGFTIGLVLSFRIETQPQIRFNKIIPELTSIFDGKIERILSKDTSYTKFIASGKLLSKGFPDMNNCRILILAAGNYKFKNLNAGSRIFCNLKIHPPTLKSLPNEPNEVAQASLIDVNWFGKTNMASLALLSKPEGFYYLREQLTESVTSRLRQLFSKDVSGLAIALVTGDQTKIPKETILSYSLSGTIHVLAVSGLHVGIISTMIILLTGFIRSRWLKFVLFSIILIFYIYFTGFQPSAIRSGLMAILALYLFTIERKISILNILSFSLVVILISDPVMIFSPGLQMSAGSIFGISIFYNHLYELFNNFSNSKAESFRFLKSSLAISIASSITVTPIVAYYFNIYSLYSPVANLLVVPLTSLSLIFSIIALFLSYVLFPLAVLYSSAAEFLLQLSNKICFVAIDNPITYLKSEFLFRFAIIVSLSIAYILFSNSSRQFFFRLVLSVCVLIPLYFEITELETNSRLIPRRDVVLAEYRLNDSIQFCLMTDRKPESRPKLDFLLEKYLLDKNNKAILGISGLNSYKIADKIKSKSNFKIVELSINDVVRINKIMFKDKAIPQIITINN